MTWWGCISRSFREEAWSVCFHPQVRINLQRNRELRLEVLPEVAISTNSPLHSSTSESHLATFILAFLFRHTFVWNVSLFRLSLCRSFFGASAFINQAQTSMAIVSSFHPPWFSWKLWSDLPERFGSRRWASSRKWFWFRRLLGPWSRLFGWILFVSTLNHEFL